MYWFWSDSENVSLKQEKKYRRISPVGTHRYVRLTINFHLGNRVGVRHFQNMTFKSNFVTTALFLTLFDFGLADPAPVIDLEARKASVANLESQVA